jgi:hypothetical protein
MRATDATVLAGAFVRRVKSAPSVWADTSLPVSYKVSSLSVGHWKSVHAGFVADAELVFEKLVQHSRMAIGDAFKEPLARMQRKPGHGKTLMSA